MHHIVLALFDEYQISICEGKWSLKTFENGKDGPQWNIVMFLI